MPYIALLQRCVTVRLRMASPVSGHPTQVSEKSRIGPIGLRKWFPLSVSPHQKKSIVTHMRVNGHKSAGSRHLKYYGARYKPLLRPDMVSAPFGIPVIEHASRHLIHINIETPSSR